MDKRGSFVFGIIVSVVLVLVAFFAAYPFIQKSISTTTGLGEGIFDESSSKKIDGYELFIKDLRACVSSVKSNCWCNIDYARLYSSLKGSTDNKVIFTNFGTDPIYFRKVSSLQDMSKEPDVVNFKSGLFSYGLLYVTYSTTNGIEQVNSIPVNYADPLINFDSLKDPQYYHPTTLLVTGLTEYYPSVVKNIIHSNGLLETQIDGKNHYVYLGNDLFIYKSSNYEYYGLSLGNSYVKDFSSNVKLKGFSRTINIANYRTYNLPGLFFITSDFETLTGYYPIENNGVYKNEEYTFKDKNGLPMFGTKEVKIRRQDNLCNEASG